MQKTCQKECTSTKGMRGENHEKDSDIIRSRIRE